MLFISILLGLYNFHQFSMFLDDRMTINVIEMSLVSSLVSSIHHHPTWENMPKSPSRFLRLRCPMKLWKMIVNIESPSLTSASKKCSWASHISYYIIFNIILYHIISYYIILNHIISWTSVKIHEDLWKIHEESWQKSPYCASSALPHLEPGLGLRLGEENPSKMEEETWKTTIIYIHIIMYVYIYMNKQHLYMIP